MIRAYQRELSVPIVPAVFVAAQAVPARHPGKWGDLSTASPQELDRISRAAWQRSNGERYLLTQGVACVLRRLLDCSGDTWQERWLSSGLDDGSVRIGQRWPDDDRIRDVGVLGLRALFSLRVICPSLPALAAYPHATFARLFTEAQDDSLLATFAERLNSRALTPSRQLLALTEIIYALCAQGIRLSDLTAEALLHHAVECRRLGVTFRFRAEISYWAGAVGWEVLRDLGHFPPTAPPSLAAALSKGQSTIEELVDRWPVQNSAIRQVLIEYLTRRRADADYSTIDNLARFLVRHFWVRIEQLNPSQSDFRLTPATYLAWREAIKYRDNGEPRLNQDSLLLAVRAFYLDLHSWAAEDPARWAC